MTTNTSPGPMPARPGAMVSNPVQGMISSGRQYKGFLGALIEMVRRKRAGQTVPGAAAMTAATPPITGPLPNVGLPTDALNIDPGENQQMLMSNPDFASAFHDRAAQQRNALNAQLAQRRAPYGIRG